MKNPFPQPPYVAYSNAGTLLVQRSGADITDEQKLFVLHAINQHEKLVGLLRVCDPILKAGVPASLRSEVRRELAALLKEEKT